MIEVVSANYQRRRKFMAVGGLTVSNCVGAYVPVGARSFADSCRNWANPSAPVTLGVAPSWTPAGGWQFDHATTWLETGLTPPNDQTWSVFVDFADTISSGNGVLVGAYNGGNGFFVLLPSSLGSTPMTYYGHGEAVARSPHILAGNLGFAGNQPYRDGLPDGAAMAPWNVTSAYTIAIGTYNYSGGHTQYYGGRIRSVVIYSTVVSAAQAKLVRASQAAL